MLDVSQLEVPREVLSETKIEIECEGLDMVTLDLKLGCSGRS